MKLIKINESQKKRLFEAYTNGFSFENLSAIGRGQFAGEDNTDAQYEYCKKYLGEPIDNGSSRVVFQLNDHFVLKLAMGYDGFAQNEREYKVYVAASTELFTKILYCAEDYSYIVCEYALPAEYDDFEKILGIPYFDRYYQHTIKEKDPNSKNNGDMKVGFDKYYDNIKPYMLKSDISFIDIVEYLSDENYNHEPAILYDKIINGSPWFTELKNLIDKYKLNVGELRISNFGIVNRNGKPTIVVLDSGLNENEKYEYDNNYY